MNIAVIAANGRSGQAFVEEALLQGHTVHAGVYGHHSLKAHPKLAIMECDATDPRDLKKLFKGQDAVVSLIGHVKGSPADVQTNAMRQIVRVMQEMGLTRIVSLTGTGVRLPEDTIPLIDRILNFFVAVFDKARIRDGRNHVAVLVQSGLAWTVIRVLKLQDVAPQPYILRAHGPTKLYVSRDEVAEAILEVLDDKTFIQNAPIICKP